MNALTLLRLDGSRVVCGLRNRLESKSLLARLRATLSIVWVVTVSAAFLAAVLRGGGASGAHVAAAPGMLNWYGASALLVAGLLADATRRGRSRRRARFEHWLMSSGVLESTLRAHAAILSVARSAALAWLPIVPVRQILPDKLSVAQAFVWAFGAVCAGESVGRAWQGWAPSFRVAWSSLIVGVWFLGVALLFGFVDDRVFLQTASHPLVLASLYAVAFWSLMRPLVLHQAPPAQSEGARRLTGIAVQGRLRGLLGRDLRVLAAFARRDWLSVLMVTFLTALAQGRMVGMARSAIVEGVRSPGGAFLTLIQAALIGYVVGEVLWEEERPGTWAFYRSAGAAPGVVLGRTVVAIAGAALWYAIVTAPTSLLLATASFEKHALGLAAICGVAGTSALGSALRAVLGSSAAQGRALRMTGMVAVAGLFFRLCAASSLVHVATGIGLLACGLGASLALLHRADLGLKGL